jgi:hypothetical protein
MIQAERVTDKKQAGTIAPGSKKDDQEKSLKRDCRGSGDLD